jgi:hypothetical protein
VLGRRVHSREDLNIGTSDAASVRRNEPTRHPDGTAEAQTDCGPQFGHPMPATPLNGDPGFQARRNTQREAQDHRLTVNASIRRRFVPSLIGGARAKEIDAGGQICVVDPSH